MTPGTAVDERAGGVTLFLSIILSSLAMAALIAWQRTEPPVIGLLAGPGLLIMVGAVVKGRRTSRRSA